MKRFDKKGLYDGIVSVLTKNGIKSQDADTIADCMISADAHGVHTHGVNMLPAYIDKLKSGCFNADMQPEIIKQTVAFSTVNANNAIGMVSAKWCMEHAVKMCEAGGVYYVFSKNSNTFGPAFYYTKLAADKGKIGICFSNTPAAMALWGGKKKMLGTNPFSVSVPGDRKGPILLDMATSAVAKSKINEIRKAGGEIPEGWALDEFGKPTTNPEEAIKGLMLPMAQHKGSGIAMIIDILSGLLSGAGFLNRVNKFYSENNECMNVGQCFIAIDPAMIYSDDFYGAIDNYIDEIHQSDEGVLFPGERELQKANESTEDGIELADETVFKIKKLFLEYGVSIGEGKV